MTGIRDDLPIEGQRDAAGNASPRELAMGDGADGLLVFGQGRFLLTRYSAVDMLVGPAVSRLGTAWRETWDLVANYCYVRVPETEGSDKDTCDAAIVQEQTTAALEAWPPASLFEHFADAWMALPVRLRSLEMSAIQASEMIRGTALEAPPINEPARDPLTDEVSDPVLPRLNEALFALVTSAHSAIEAYSYAVTILIALRNPRLVRLTKPEDFRRISVLACRKLLEGTNGYPRARVTRRLRLLVESAAYQQLAKARHMLVHRGMPFGCLFASTHGGAVYVAQTQAHMGRELALSPTEILTIAAVVGEALRALVTDTVELAQGLQRPAPGD